MLIAFITVYRILWRILRPIATGSGNLLFGDFVVGTYNLSTPLPAF